MVEETWLLHYPTANRLLILADCGGSNGYRPRTWKKFLQEKLADDFGLTITVAHYPSGASKWNPIEHRMFSEISKNWAGEPLESFDSVINFAKKTRTKSGLQIDAVLDNRQYEKRLRVTDIEMNKLSINKDLSCGKWNYTIEPRHQTKNIFSNCELDEMLDTQLDDLYTYSTMQVAGVKM